ncbi:Fantastic Four domain [Dillenia turbinata]|uniref:Fantastic Four domain n=1 Tax=Dillenia turbinata TaxID=194707 RepID=A0AAN8V325_9MAGN
MAACGSLKHIFDNPLPEKPSLIESLSAWNQINPSKSVGQSSFTEIFGELHFQESPHSSSTSSSLSPSPFLPSSSTFSLPSSSLSSSSSSLTESNLQESIEKLHHENKSNNEHSEDNEIEKSPSSMNSFTKRSYMGSSHRSSDSFSSMNSDSLQLCTEGLGFESSDDVEEFSSDVTSDRLDQEEKMSCIRPSSSQSLGVFKRVRTTSGVFPPPISCIGRTGKPWVCFRSYRQDGRFVLKEIRIPTQEFLHACRENGRLKLQFVQPGDETLEEEEEGEELDDVQEVDEEWEEESENDDAERNADEEELEVKNEIAINDVDNNVKAIL